MTYYVYAYLDPRRPGNYENSFIKFDFEPIYIGKGVGRRSHWHLKRKDMHPLVQKIEKIRAYNLEPLISKIAFFDIEEDAYIFEEKLIREIGFNGNGSLTNIYPGGKGTKSGKENFFFGKHHTNDAKQKISEALKTREHTQESRLKRSIAQTGVQFSEERKKNISAGKTGKKVKATEKLKQSRRDYWDNVKVEYKVILPSGETINRITLRVLCKEHNLYYRQVLEDISINNMHNGFTLVKIEGESN